MRIMQQTDGVTKLWLSARDTYRWAHKPGASWPCSGLSGCRLYVQFDSAGNLIDYSVNGQKVGVEIDIVEFNAIVNDHLPAGHPGRRETA